jgi:ketosteroid isomerase-like protein
MANWWQSEQRLECHMGDAKRRELVAAYIAAYNTFDVDGMAALLSPDVCFENFSGAERSHATRGIDQFRQLAESSKALFSEREQKVAALESHGDSLVATIEFNGRLAADIPGGPSRGTVIAMQGASEFSFENDRISKVIDRA